MDNDTHFPLFGHLHTELRLKIWSFALSDARRVVEIGSEKGI